MESYEREQVHFLKQIEPSITFLIVLSVEAFGINEGDVWGLVSLNKVFFVLYRILKPFYGILVLHVCVPVGKKIAPTLITWVLLGYFCSINYILINLASNPGS